MTNEADLKTLWEKKMAMRAEIRDEDRPAAEERGFVEAQRDVTRAINSAASEFLAKHGYLSNGRNKKKIPGL